MTRILTIAWILIVYLAGCDEPLRVQSISSPAGDSSQLPNLFTDEDGIVFMSWVEERNDTASLYYASYQDQTWSAPVFVQSSAQWFVNWADFPSVIAHEAKPMVAHWLAKKPGGTYSYDVEIMSLVSTDEVVRSPHTDNTPTEHGFVSMTPVTDSTFYAIWLDGRHTAGRSHHEYSDLSKAMTLRGALLSVDELEFLEESEIDPSVCDCCNTALAKTSDGLIAAYRDRTSEEIRDISIRRYVDGTWSEPFTFSDEPWQTSSCPVNGPQLSVYDEMVAVAWFSGANDQPKVNVAFSTDGGSVFADPITIDSETPLGRVDLEQVDRDKAWVSWMSRNGDTATINLMHINTDGERLDSLALSTIDPSRKSGFPQLTRTENGLLLAWTDIEKKTIEVVEVQL